MAAIQPCSQSILVTGPDTSQPQFKIFNGQAGRIVSSTSQSAQRTSLTLHFEDWIEEASFVYVAPEAIGNRNFRDELCHVFSLGALAFHIYRGKRNLGAGLAFQRAFCMRPAGKAPC